jgi:hypothetical protein
MREWKQLTSIKGVKCHMCQKFIRKGKKYFRYGFPGRRYQLYHNCCVECFFKETERDFLDGRKYVRGLKSFRKKAETLRVKYQEDDKSICEGCRWKFKHITMTCNPDHKSCRHKKGKFVPIGLAVEPLLKG